MKKILTLLLCLVSCAAFAQTNPSWQAIREKPTNLDGYGITDALKLDLSNATEAVNLNGAAIFRKALRVNESSVVDVTDFGAIPDDGADDYEAFISAKAHLTNGSTLRIPQGVYHSSGSIHVTGIDDLRIDCLGRIAPYGSATEIFRVTDGKGIIGNIRIGAESGDYGEVTSALALGLLDSANLIVDIAGYSGAATQTMYLFTNPNSVFTVGGTTHYCDSIGDIVISIGSGGFHGPISTDKLDKLHFSGNDLSIAGNISADGTLSAHDLHITNGVVSVTGGGIVTDQTLTVGAHAQITGLLYADGGVRGNVEATNATIASLSLGYNNNLNIATATVNRLTSPVISAGSLTASGKITGNQLIASSAIIDSIYAKSILASSTHYDFLSAIDFVASTAQIINASATIIEADSLQADQATIASATINRLLVETPIQAPAGIEFGDRILMNTRPLGRNIEHGSESAGIRLATGSVSLTADDPDNPSVTISSLAVNSSGTVTVYGQHFVLGANTASFPADVSMQNRLKVGGIDYGSISTYDLDAYRISSPYASHTQRLSALRLNFLSSLTHEDIPGSFITAHPLTGAVQHFFNNEQQITLGVAGVSITDLRVSDTVLVPFSFGSVGSINAGQWEVGDGVNTVSLLVNKGNLTVGGTADVDLLKADAASTSSLLAGEATIASASILRLEVGEIVGYTPPVATAPAVLAETTSTTLPIGFKHPSYPSSRDSDSGIYSPAGYQLAFRVGSAPGTTPWLRMFGTGGELSGNVNQITKVSGSATGITYSGGTLFGSGKIFLGPNSSPYVSLSNGNTEMLTTYGGIVRIGNVDWAEEYFFSVGGRSRVEGKLDVTDGINLSRSSPPSIATNGTIYYDSTTHKFKGYANGSWVDLN